MVNTQYISIERLGMGNLHFFKTKQLRFSWLVPGICEHLTDLPTKNDPNQPPKKNYLS